MISLLQPQTMAQKQEGRKTIPVFTVFKNGAYVKNIILQSPFSVSDSKPSQEDCSLMVGRHHDCDIVLEHPSISRYHLQLKFNESSKKMSVMDLSSVHGTVISGEKIKPRVSVQVEEGDVLKFGASTRLYKLKWVSSVSDLEAESDAGSSSLSQHHEDGSGQIGGTDEHDQWRVSAPPMEPEHQYSLGDRVASTKETHSCGIKEKPNTNIWLRRCSSASAPRIRTLSKKDNELDLMLYSGANDLNNELLANINQGNRNNNDQDAIDFQETEFVQEENIYLRRCLSSSESGIRMTSEKDKELVKVLSETRIFMITEKDKDLDTNDAERNQTEKKSGASVTYPKETEISAGKEQSSVSEMEDWVGNSTNSHSQAVIPVNEQGVLPESCFNTLGDNEIVLVSNVNASTQVPQCILKQNQVVAHEEGAVEDKENKGDFNRIELDNTITNENFQPMPQCLKKVVLPPSCFTSFSEEGKIDNHCLQVPLCSLKSNVEVSVGKDSTEENKENQVNRDFHGINLDIITASIENLQDELVAHNDKITYEGNSVEDKENLVALDFHGIHFDSTAVSESLQEEIVAHNDEAMYEEDSVEYKENYQVTVDFHGIHLNFLAPSKNLQEEIVSNIDRVTYEEDSVENKENQVTLDFHGIHLDITAGSERLQDEIVSLNNKISYAEGSVESKENQVDGDFHGTHLDITGESENLQDEIVFHNNKVEKDSIEDKENQVTRCFHVIQGIADVSEHLQGGSVSHIDIATLNHEELGEQFESGLLHNLFSVGQNEQEHTFLSDQENLTPNSSNKVSFLSMVETNEAEETNDNPFQGLSFGSCFRKNENEDIILSKSSSKKFPSHILGSRRRLCYVTESSSTTKHITDEQVMHQRILDTSWKDNNLINYETEGAFFQPDKENLTPLIHSTQVLKSSLKLSSKKIIVEAENCRVTAVAGLDMQQSECRNDSPCCSNMDGMFPSDKENLTPMPSRSLKSKAQSSSKFREQRRFQERVPFQNLLVCSPSVNSVESQGDTKGSPVSTAPRSRVPFQSLLDNTRRSPSITASRTTINKSCSSVVQPLDPETVVKKAATKMKWYMVVDVSCLLNPKSRRSLMLMEGLKGTQLIVPRMVIRELDSLKNRAGIFRRESAASLVMRWIEECMVKMSWWIHVQSSNECVPVAVTPPVSPHMVMQSSQGRGEPGAYNAAASFATCTQIPFSSFGSFAEIVSPTADDHVLDCALHFKTLKADGNLILLTKQVGLKIKALAEGMICESPEEFCQSLVNPYSERFLWLESTPRGPTWSSIDGVGGLIGREPVGESNRKPFAGGVKGLKLVLSHNYRYGKFNSVA